MNGGHGHFKVLYFVLSTNWLKPNSSSIQDEEIFMKNALELGQENRDELQGSWDDV